MVFEHGHGTRDLQTRREASGDWSVWRQEGGDLQAATRYAYRPPAVAFRAFSEAVTRERRSETRANGRPRGHVAAMHGDDGAWRKMIEEDEAVEEGSADCSCSGLAHFLDHSPASTYGQECP